MSDKAVKKTGYKAIKLLLCILGILYFIYIALFAASLWLPDIYLYAPQGIVRDIFTVIVSRNIALWSFAIGAAILILLAIVLVNKRTKNVIKQQPQAPVQCVEEEIKCRSVSKHDTEVSLDGATEIKTETIVVEGKMRADDIVKMYREKKELASNEEQDVNVEDTDNLHDDEDLKFLSRLYYDDFIE